MADAIIRGIVAKFDEVLKAINFAPSANGTVAADATPAKPKIPSTPEGIAVAYGAIVVMAVLPVYFGAMRSVWHQKKQKVRTRTQIDKYKKSACVKPKSSDLNAAHVRKHDCACVAYVERRRRRRR